MSEASHYKLTVDGETPLYTNDWTEALNTYWSLHDAGLNPGMWIAGWSMVDVPQSARPTPPRSEEETTQP